MLEALSKLNRIRARLPASLVEEVRQRPESNMGVPTVRANEGNADMNEQALSCVERKYVAFEQKHEQQVEVTRIKRINVVTNTTSES